MEDLPLGRIAALVPEFAVKDRPLSRTLMMMMMMMMMIIKEYLENNIKLWLFKFFPIIVIKTKSILVHPKIRV